MAKTQAQYGNPANYNVTPDTRIDGQPSAFEVDAKGNLLNHEAYAPGYEDNVAGVAKVEMRNSYQNITTLTTTIVKSGSGLLHTITFNKPVSTGVVAIYDNTAGSGTLIGTITSPTSTVPISVTYDVTFSTGLTLVSSVAAQDITVSYR